MHVVIVIDLLIADDTVSDVGGGLLLHLDISWSGNDNEVAVNLLVEKRRIVPMRCWP